LRNRFAAATRVHESDAKADPIKRPSFAAKRNRK
jgi:hypothetical protein